MSFVWIKKNCFSPSGEVKRRGQDEQADVVAPGGAGEVFVDDDLRNLTRLNSRKIYDYFIGHLLGYQHKSDWKIIGSLTNGLAF